MTLFTGPAISQYFQPISRSAYIINQPYKFGGIYFYFVQRNKSDVPFSLSPRPHVIEFYRRNYNSSLEYGYGFNIDLPIAADISIGGKYSPGSNIAFDTQVNVGRSILNNEPIQCFGYVSVMHSIKMVTFGVREMFWLYPDIYLMKKSIFPFMNIHFGLKANNNGIVVEVQQMLELKSYPLDSRISSGFWLLSIGTTF